MDETSGEPSAARSISGYFHGSRGPVTSLGQRFSGGSSSGSSRSADVIQTKGLAQELRLAAWSELAFTSCGMLLNVPRRMRLAVISPEKRSTAFNHEELVGVSEPGIVGVR